MERAKNYLCNECPMHAFGNNQAIELGIAIVYLCEQASRESSRADSGSEATVLINACRLARMNKLCEETGIEELGSNDWNSEIYIEPGERISEVWKRFMSHR